MYKKSEIEEAVDALCDILKKYYPTVFENLYDNSGFPSTCGTSFKERMEFAVYIELLKADVLKND